MKDQKKSKKVEFSLETIQNNAVTRKQLEGFIEEVVISKQKMKHEQEAIKDIMNEAKESLGVPGKILNKLVKERMSPGSIDADIRDRIRELSNMAAELERVISQCAGGERDRCAILGALRRPHERGTTCAN